MASHPKGSAQKHESALEKLLHTPRLLGINEPVVWSTKGMLIYRHNSIELLTDIDLLYFTGNRAVIAEYKCSPGHFREASKQLELGAAFVRDQFRVTPQKLYVVGDDYSYHMVP